MHQKVRTIRLPWSFYQLMVAVSLAVIALAHAPKAVENAKKALTRVNQNAVVILEDCFINLEKFANAAEVK